MPNKLRKELDDIELRITEDALRLLMGEIASYGIEPEPPSGRVHECSVCRKRDIWGPDWMWFGRLSREEEGLIVCSRPCFEHVSRLEFQNA